MAIKIGHAASNYDKVNGDGNGKEVCIRNWYKGGWHTVLRPKRKAVAEASARACEAACANDNLGYNSSVKFRNTFYQQLLLVNFDPSKIKEKCDTDCSGLMHGCAVAGGAAVYHGSNAVTTKSIVEHFVDSGEYEALKEQKYLESDKHLLRGDILVKSGHTVMALEDGEAAREKVVGIELPVLKQGAEGETVEALQRILSTYGYSLGNKNPYDGKFGAKTDAAVREFQADNNLTIDGEVGEETWPVVLGVK